MPERYVTYADFDLYVRSETIVDTGLKRAALDAATIGVDNALGRKMIVASTASARVFRPTSCGSSVLWLDDFTTLTSLVENGVTLVNNTDFVLEPLNGLSAAGETVPFDRALRQSAYWYANGVLPSVTVTAAWGWPAIPPQVVEMCKIVGKAMLETRNFSLGIIALADGGAFGARETKVVKDTITAYRSHRKLVLG